MRKPLLLTAVFAVFFVVYSCKRQSDFATKTNNASSVEVAQKANRGSMKWGKNDDIYKEELKAIAKELKKSLASREIEPDPEPEPNPQPSYSCTASGGNVYGYYEDPENLVIGGPYNSASSSGQETFFQTCSNVTSAISSARTYLTNEGYSDIVTQLGNESYNLIHAANSLMDLKKQVGMSTNNQAARMANCVFQALGFTALAELGANWAAASRQTILRAVGKVASRYLGWFGAAIAVVSFVDCMWG